MPQATHSITPPTESRLREHALARLRVYRGEARTIGEGVKLGREVRLGCGGVVDGVEALVLHVKDGEEVRPNADPLGGEHLEGDATREAKRRGEASGEVATTGNVLVAVPLLPGGEVGVAGTRHLEEVVVVTRARVGVLDDGGKRCPAGGTVHVEAAHDAGAVLLAARRGPAALAGCATRHEGSEGILVDRDSRGQALDDATDGGGVGLSKHGDAERLSKARGHL